MSLELSVEKIKQLLNLIDRFLDNHTCRVRELAQLIGCLVASCPAVAYGWLYYKSLERTKYLALMIGGDDYDIDVTIPQSSLLELQWWKEKIHQTSNPIRTLSFVKEIFSDASKTGWGAF